MNLVEIICEKCSAPIDPVDDAAVAFEGKESIIYLCEQCVEQISKEIIDEELKKNLKKVADKIDDVKRNGNEFKLDST